MSLSALTKVVLGFFIAIALIVSGGYLAAQYVIAEFTKPPTKPIFPNDKTAQKPKPAASPTPVAAASPKVSPAAVSSPLQPSPAATPSPQATSPSPQPLPATSYPARITLSEGLNLRNKPSVDGDRIGGVDFDEQVVVIEESPDKAWQKVRLQSSNVEGWIRAGYTQRAN